ncbi:reverse transcriptase [Gossypium australe]|uniref:Reverse transcriptase n=1 Tax=Gossypium australe TaxID=47621 RepID=A0A5B6VBZ9_9ROSI|nr:reverse transcriptase [Gossypium australe]
MNTRLSISDDGSIVAELKVRPKNDVDLQAKLNPDLEFQIGSDCCLLFRDRLCVPKNSELVQKILYEAHNGTMSVHPSST